MSVSNFFESSLSPRGPIRTCGGFRLSIGLPESEGVRMQSPEIGLSMYQPIRETCFSGYVEVQEKNERLVVGVEVVEQFEGDASLEIVLLADSDDCMASAIELHRTKPLSQDDLEGGRTLGFAIVGRTDRYFCLQYVVSGGTFTKGKVTARVSNGNLPWFVTSADLVEVSGASFGKQGG